MPMFDDLQALILLGGQGTRIATLYPDRPKALIPVGTCLFIERQIQWLAEQGIKKIHLAAGYQGAKIQQWLDSNPLPLPLSITISLEPEPLGTGGGARFAAKFIGANQVLMLNGDSLLPGLDLPAMCRVHNEQPDKITMALTSATNADQYGLVILDGADYVAAFHEKANTANGLVNAGAYLCAKELLLQIPAAPPAVSLERDIFPDLARKKRIRGFVAPPPLLDMGTPAGLQRMTSYFAN